MKILKKIAARKDLLEKIGAKCDLAEAYYQLALTYQAMAELDQSQEYFTKAIQLYEEMEAPKQVEKVHRAMIPPAPLPFREGKAYKKGEN